MSVNIYNKADNSLSIVSGIPQGLPFYSITENEYNLNKSKYDAMNAIIYIKDGDSPEKMDKVNPVAEGDLLVSGEITDGNGNKLSTLANQIDSIERGTFSFSTEEKKTNEFWINGKPIYRKIISFNAGTNDKTEIAHNIEDIDLIWIDCENTFKYDTANNTYCPYFIAGIDSNAFVSGNINIIQNVDSINIYERSGTDVPAGIWYVSLKYTKTTDEGSIS